MTEFRQDALIRQLQGAIALLQGQVGDLAFTVGSSNLSWTASTTSGVVSAAHGLDTAPLAVLAILTGPPSAGGVTTPYTTNYGGTTFDIFAVSASSNSGTSTAFWLAVTSA